MIGIVSAPLWDSRNSTFAGLLTSTDYINVIQYYCLYPNEINEVDRFRLCQLRGKWTRSPRLETRSRGPRLMALCRYRKGDRGSPAGDVVRPSHASAV